ncbi:MAG: SMI1/KNR4 family protein [bacterium]|nr:SMI1/KNR4 family protein [bacterium]
MFSYRLKAGFERARRVLDQAGLDLDISFHAAATPVQIGRCETEIALSLPQDLRAFLLQHDGLRLCIRSRSENLTWAILNVLGTSAIPDPTFLIRECSSAVILPSQARGAAKLIACVALFDAHCIMVPGPAAGWSVYEAVATYSYDWQDSEPIASGFEDFMDKVVANLIAGGDIYYWSGEPPVWEATDGTDC